MSCRYQTGAGATAAAVCSAVALLAGCHRAVPAAEPPAIVVALPLQHQATDAGDTLRYPVEVGARYSNAMSFRVNGKIVERSVRLGDWVKRGQVLARLDPIDIEKQLASTQAAFDAAEHRLAFARRQLDRDQAQIDRNLIAANQFEQTQDAYTAAQSERDQAAATLAVARNSLAYTSLTADHDGVITSENADTGQVVTAGQAVYGLAWNGDSDVLLDAAESDLSHFSIGQAARVAFAALPGRQFDARVREIAPAADPQSRTYRIKLTLAPPDQAVRLGMTGDGMLPASASADRDATDPIFSVPVTALFHEDSHPAVWLVDANSVLQLRAVQVLRYAQDAVLISRGLHDGDLLVLAGVHTVYAGEHVSAVRPLYDEHGDIVPATVAQGR